MGGRSIEVCKVPADIPAKRLPGALARERKT
jgi:hypothetical protein